MAASTSNKRSSRKKASSSTASARRRTQIVWCTFLGAVTLVTGLLALQSPHPQPGFLLTSLDTVAAAGTHADPIFTTTQPLDQKRWTGIVIHDSGEPAGDATSLHRQHVSHGYQGLGYHFLIGNGNGLGDGVIHVGYRWDQQLPGAHCQGGTAIAQEHNQHSVAICLIGNGDRRPFTDRQMAQLANLVQRLQHQLNIPARKVHLHRDLAATTSSPGQFFASARLQQQLRP